MVDVIKSLEIEYVPSNSASSFRGLHELLINYGKNKKPEFLTVTHEEIGVAMAHGYFKVAGKPLMTLCHGTVGLQHAAMAIYNAWCDRVPVIVVGGNDLDAAQTSAGSANLPLGAGRQRTGARFHQVGRHAGLAAALRAIDRARLQDRDDAALRPGHDRARRGPAAGAGRASNGEKLYIPKYTPTSPPPARWARCAKPRGCWPRRENPVIAVSRAARTENGVRSACASWPKHCRPASSITGERMNFPKTHHLSAGLPAVANADVILGMELYDFWGW